MYSCPKCNGFGYLEDHSECQVCLTLGVVMTLYTECPNCQGKKCYQCKQKGYIIQPQPFVLPSRRVDMNKVRHAFTLSRIGHSGEDTLSIPYKRKKDVEVDPFVYGTIPVLLEISEERSGPSTAAGDWFKELVLGSDALIIEPSGMWSEKNGEGIRIYAYDTIEP